MNRCHVCTTPLDLGREVGRRDECPQCHADLHCCLNCRFFDRAVSKQCREPQADLVRQKDKANFCDFFAFTAAPASSADDAGRARQTLDDLFRK